MPKRILKYKLLILLINFVYAWESTAQSFILDSSFSNDGKVITDYLGNDDRARTIAIQTDRKLIVAGKSNNDFILMRYTESGILDTSFDQDGIVTTDISNSNDEGKSLAIQLDGKIVLAGITTKNGNANFALARYHPNGSLDSTFSSDGKLFTPIGAANDEGKSVVLQTDGKIIIAGQSVHERFSDFALVRYHSNGIIDSSFDADGIVTTDFNGLHDEGNCIKIQKDGKILVAGYSDNGAKNDFAIARYKTNGSLDSTFGIKGKRTVSLGPFSDIAFTMTLQTDENILIAGISFNGSNTDFAVIRLDKMGSLDNSFDQDGKQSTSIGLLDDECKTMALQADGKILLGGMSQTESNKDFAMIRYLANGRIDSTFDTDGRLTTDFANSSDDAFTMLIQVDGKIVIAGETQNVNLNFAIARFKNHISTYLFSPYTADQIKVIVYPNPMTDVLTINFSAFKSGPYFLIIYNSLGQSVYSNKLIAAQTKLNYKLPNGNYYYSIHNPNGIHAANGSLAVK